MRLSLLMQYQFDNPTCGTYSVFDSHPRDVTGNPTPEGAAVLHTFDWIEDLSQYLLRLYPNILFKTSIYTYYELIHELTCLFYNKLTNHYRFNYNTNHCHCFHYKYKTKIKLISLKYRKQVSSTVSSYVYFQH